MSTPAPSLAAQNVEDVYPLSPLQQGMLFHTLLHGDSGVYLMQDRYRIGGRVDHDAFLRAWQLVVAAHPALRTSFVWKTQKQPMQVVHKEVDVPVEFVDLRDRSPDEQTAYVDKLLAEEQRQGFNLTKAPLIRFRLVRLDETAYEFIRSFHHVLMDAWCISLVTMDFVGAYEALCQGRPPVLRQPRPYRDYIRWLQQQDSEAARRFWQQQLRGLDAPTPLVIDQAPRANYYTSAVLVDDRITWLDPDRTQAVHRFCRQQGITPNTLFQGVWALLLSRYSGSRDVLFGVTVSGRPPNLAGVEEMIGLFINTLPLRVTLPADEPLLSWLHGLQAQNLDVREFEHTPLVDIQGWSALPRGEPLFDSILVYENAPIDERILRGDFSFRLEGMDHSVHTHYGLTVVILPGERLGIRISYDRNRFEAAAIERLLGHLVQLLSAMLARPEAGLDDFEPLTRAERRQLLVEWNQTAEDFPLDKSYAELFAERVAAHPERVAVIGGDEPLTYAELDARANRLAHALAAAGATSDNVVALLAARGPALITMMIATLKAGAAFLPLEIDHPPARLRALLKQAQAPLLVVSEECLALGEALRIGETLLVAEAHWNQGNTGCPEPPRSSHDLAYVLFTSGSTGSPKGVLIEQAGLLNNIFGKVPTLGLGEHDRIAQTASVAFDVAVWQCLGAPLVGATVHVLPPAIAQNPQDLIEAVEDQGITLLEVVPSLLQTMLSVCPAHLTLKHLRWFILTGEALSPALARAWFERFPHVPLMNAYGPAECSDDVAFHALTQVPDPDCRHLPIGRPTPNNQIFLLDESLRPVPVGVPGEICIGGVGVGRGYLNDPEKTRTAFVSHPFRPGERLYRSGDSGRYRSDGLIEYLGRKDQQVKLRGQRIELGEIEALLLKQPLIAQAAVVLCTDLATPQLVAYVVARAEPDLCALKTALQEQLPPAMVPARFVFLDALPLNPNGKIDRKALPKPCLKAEENRFVAPRTATETQLAALWAEVLALPQVGVETSFFELGGHSLLATQVISRIRTVFKRELPLRAVFEHPTVAALARVIDQQPVPQAVPSRPPLAPQPRPDKLPLSFAQQRLWFLEQFNPGSSVFNIPFALKLEGTLDVEALRRSFEALLARHEVLRTAFESENGEPRQVVVPETDFELPLVDLAALDPDARQASVQGELARFFEEPFDLTRPPLLRARVWRLGPQHYLLAVALHHLISDAWSATLAIRELAECYQALFYGRPASLPELPIQYADFALWQRHYLQGPVLERELAYWRQILGPRGGEAPRYLLNLATDKARPAVQSYRAGSLIHRLPQDLSERLHRFAAEQGLSGFAVVFAGFAVLLHRLSAQTDVFIGTPVSNRQQAGTENLLGILLNNLVIRSRLDDTLDFARFARQIGNALFDAQAHQDLPFEQLVNSFTLPRSLAHAPLFQVMVAQQLTVESRIRFPDLRFEVLDTPLTHSECDLDLHVACPPSAPIELELLYALDLFHPETAARLLARLEDWLATLVARPRTPIVTLLQIVIRPLAKVDPYCAPCPCRPPPQPSPLARGREPKSPPYQGGDLEGVFTSANTANTLTNLCKRSIDRNQTASGKVDPQAPPAPTIGKPLAPRTETERRLAAIWCEVLQLDAVGVKDNFFALGGHSLLITQVMARVRAQFAVGLRLRVLFEHPTVAALAEQIDKAARQCVANLAAGGRPQRLPLSYAQQRLWFLSQLEPGGTQYNMPFAIRFTGELHAGALAQAFDDIVARHEILRSRVIGAEPALVISGEPPALSIEEIAGRRWESAQATAIEQEGRQPFDLATQAPIRARLLRCQFQQALLLLTLHHSVADDWSIRILLEELAAAYQARLHDQAPALPPLAAQYVDYSLWQRRPEQQRRDDRELAYWTRTLGRGDYRLQLPTDFAPSQARDDRAEHYEIILPDPLYRAVQNFARPRQVTPFVVHMAVLHLLLRRYSGQEDIRVGTPVAGRHHPDTHGLIGCFVNTLVIRSRLADEGALTFDNLVRRIGQTVIEAQEHQDVPFERVVEKLVEERDLDRSPLFQVMLSMEHTRLQPWPDLALEEVAMPTTDAQFDLSFDLYDSGEGASLRVSYRRALFQGARMRRLLDHWLHLLQQGLANPEARLAAFTLVTPAERQRLLDFNRSAHDFPLHLSFGELFDRQAEKDPGWIVAGCAGQTLTYAELARRSRRLARAFAAAGLFDGHGDEPLVALLGERGLPFLAALVSTLGSGAAYLPLDPNLPDGRLAELLALGQPPLLVSTAACRDRALAAGQGCPVLVIEEHWLTGAAAPLERRGSPASLAYVLFTSGSTGTPKGVMVEQRGMLNNIFGKQPTLGLDKNDVIAQTASQAFDISVWQLLAGPVTGARVEILPDAVAHDPARLLAAIDVHGITLLEAVPAVIRGMLDAAADHRTRLPSLRWLLATGENLPAQLANDWLARFPAVPIMNAYGPAECADDVAFHPITAPLDPSLPVPIGRPTANNELLILDPAGRLQPPGIAGEIGIGGVGVGRGYWRDEKGTREAFVDHPLDAGARFYRSGDLGRWREDGTIEYLGRRDFQIKVRGHRIEPGEIESRLEQHPQVKTAAVVAPENRRGERQLVGYWTRRGGDIQPAELGAWLAARIPAYMVPSLLPELPEMPLNRNGKIDRRALLARPLEEVARQRRAPSSPTEVRMAALWRQVLTGVGEISAEDNFFALGGHSLLVTRLVALIRDRWGVVLPLRSLFEHPTLAALAALIDGGRVGTVATPGPSLGRYPRPDRLPLSFEQRRLWLLSQLEPGSNQYNVPFALKLSGPLDDGALQDALERLAQRHEILRSRIQVQDETPYLVIDAVPPRLQVTTLAGDDWEDRVRAALQTQACKPFDLARKPPLRVQLLRRKHRQEAVLIITQHHVVTDDWSVQILLDELGECYAAARERRPAALPPLPLQYVDYSLWQQAPEQQRHFAAQLDYWRETLGEAPYVLDLPMDHPPAAGAGAALSAGEHWITLPAPLAGSLRAYARQRGSTVFVVMMAALHVLLARYCNQPDVRVGTPVSGRRQLETQGLLGCFVNTLVIDSRVDDDASFDRLVTHLRQRVLAAQEHQDVPFERVVNALVKDRDFNRSPLFQVMLSMENSRIDNRRWPGLSLTEIAMPATAAQFAQSWEVYDDAESLTVKLCYDRTLFEDAGMARWLHHWQKLLATVLATPQRPLAQLDWLPDAERHRLLVNFNQSQQALALEYLGRRDFDVFVQLKALPLNANGKVDRQALPRPSLQIWEAVAAREGNEATLCELIESLLGVKDVRANDNFFALGGDSILALQLISRARQRGITLTPKLIFQQRSIRDLARAADSLDPMETEQGRLTGDAPLTPVQHWFFEQGFEHPNHWNQALLWQPQGHLDATATEQALRHLVGHHDALRLRFTETTGGWRQSYGLPENAFRFVTLDGVAPQALAEAMAPLAAGLDIRQGPISQAALVTLSDGRQRLYWVIHHLAIDTVSWHLLQDDFATVYGQMAEGRPAQLPPKTSSYRQWADHWRSVAVQARLAQQRDWWLRQDIDFTLPVAHPDAPHRVGDAETLTAILDEQRTGQFLKQAQRAYRTRPEELLLAALAVTLSQWSGQSPVRLDLEHHGRTRGGERLDVSRTVGWFAAIYPLKLDVPQPSEPGHTLCAMKEQLRAVPDHGVGYGALRYLAEGGQALTGRHRSRVSFEYFGVTRQDDEAGEPVPPERAPDNHCEYELDVTAQVLDGRLRLEWTYGRLRDRRETQQRHLDDFVARVQALIDHCLEPDAGRLTPADFPMAKNLTQDTLNALLQRFGSAPQAGAGKD